MDDIPETPEDTSERRIARKQRAPHTVELNRMELEFSLVDMMEAEDVAELRANHRWVRDRRLAEKDRDQARLHDWRARKQAAWTATIATIVGLAIGVMVDKFKVIAAIFGGHPP